MNIPKELKYTPKHIWLDIMGNEAYVGLTDYAQEEMGDILFVDLPDTEVSFDADETFCEVESSKTTQELSLPFGFSVVEVNDGLDDSPENINEDAYKNYIVKISFDETPSGLLSWEEYENITKEE